MSYTFRGFIVEPSTRKDKKYMATVDGKKVHFGAAGYEHFHDKIGHYSSLDHNDKTRREAYRKRHGAIEGEPHKIKGTAAWFAWNALW